ncbi:catalase-related peroxidase precursor [Variibacter gotjawalensis]|uniref:Catalase-related peroxidase n=1 Tax=Variibacter gotjawalensis TaxID=1333996 RepID=A0A0S3PPR5_9BRAD|nr:catalase family peroxidase [Variibacter gotjawalensis]NIK48223.1 catalase [Variibacter gotjawalensis]RZS50095.1 catalase [Variibacter gotjawalensis]BAT57925.1 catalase-related peroxidase precursor [Variibacter gotjawalensis]
MTKIVALMFSTAAALLSAGPALAQTPAAPAQPAAAEVDPQAIVDLQFAIAGNHKKVRASGAKGVCVKGEFTPSAEAASLSKAPHFAKPVPMTARFSMGGGNPNISDKTKPTTRGFAMEFEIANDPMVFYFISAPVFGARTPRQLHDGISARLPGPDGKPDAEKIKAFVAANPETTRQAAWLNARPVPASFGGVNYWGVQAFTLTNAAGKPTITKLKAIPTAGQLGLSDDELKAKPDSFYADELTERLGKGPMTFDFVAILGEPGDPTNDSTAMWPEDNRKTVKLGTIAISAIQANTICDEKPTDPVANLPQGVAGPADDPMFEIRSPAYAISRGKRAQ